MKSAVKTALWLAGSITVAGAVIVPKLLATQHDAKPTGGASTTAVIGVKGDAKPRPSSGEGRSATAVPLKVSTMRVVAAPLVETISATGTLIATEGVELQAETNGRVTAIHFREGARVRKGELLVKLNDAELQATLVRSRYQLALAETREKRLAPLIQQGLVRQEDYDIALSELNVQRAQIELTQAQIAGTEIRAPFDGVVGLRYVSEGSFVSVNTRVATLQQLDQLKIDFAVPEKYAQRIRVGGPLRFSVDGATAPFSGRIYAYDPRIDAGTRSLQIRAITDNRDGRLLPGTFASIELVLDQVDDALVVPAVAVIPGLNEKTVFVVDADHKAERRAVETGTRSSTTVQILSGLKPGELLITSGLQNLRPGQAVLTDDDAGTPRAAAIANVSGVGTR